MFLNNCVFCLNFGCITSYLEKSILSWFLMWVTLSIRTSVFSCSKKYTFTIKITLNETIISPSMTRSSLIQAHKTIYRNIFKRFSGFTRITHNSKVLILDRFNSRERLSLNNVYQRIIYTYPRETYKQVSCRSSLKSFDFWFHYHYWVYSNEVPFLCVHDSLMFSVLLITFRSKYSKWQYILAWRF